MPLENRTKTIEHVYFIERGFASVVANGSGRAIEVGLIGREGMTGLAVVMGTDRTPHDTYMQAAGNGQRISSAKLRSAMEQSPALHRFFLLYGHAFVVQTAQTALVNGRSKIEERLARWLLMAHDRLDDDTMPLTHEFLSVMLGVRRPGVTVALDTLEKGGLIRATRGAVTILNRTGLKKISNRAYGAAEAEFQRLFG
jgi:CRP-like cAMP-binding protein